MKKKSHDWRLSWAGAKNAARRLFRGISAAVVLVLFAPVAVLLAIAVAILDRDDVYDARHDG